MLLFVRASVRTSSSVGLPSARQAADRRAPRSLLRAAEFGAAQKAEGVISKSLENYTAVQRAGDLAIR